MVRINWRDFQPYLYEGRQRRAFAVGQLTYDAATGYCCEDFPACILRSEACK